ncbi:MAG TPA: ABC transporter substrate-binding protein [Candidatus Binatia bacterium]|jgi:ABC-type nitrate/sulfonate/bicarbonate transport system substrate-binding protein
MNSKTVAAVGLSFVLIFGLLQRDAPAQDKAKLIPVMEGISSPDFGYLPSYLARAKGFLEKEGLDMKIIVMRANVSVPALVTGEIQFAVHGSAMTASIMGAPLKAIYFTYNTSILQFTVRPEIQKPEDLKGKVVAIASPGGSQDQATRLILKKLGLDPERDVKLLPIGDAKARVIGMDTGQIAGSANNLDIAAELVRKGYRIIANSSEVYPVPFSGFAANDQFLKKNPEIVKKWLRAHVRSLLFIRQNPDEAAQVAAKELKLNPEVAREAIRQSIGFLSPDDPGGFTERGIRLHIQYSAARTNVDPEKVKISDVADATLLREVQREMGIQCRGGYLCPQGAVK